MFAMVEPPAESDPLAVLFLKVIEMGLKDLRVPKQRYKVIEWLYTDDFLQVCGYANLEPDWVRGIFDIATAGEEWKT